ncbi:uncharacterized protein LOC143188656 isoform X2 [Calliopsis andreniformis]|uniref:uncharacterized protein LOC143188656 isoform X2 n=1 Tax=Calliopsis andreniformis TaxID=337506 RepID=UPI003FCE8088
MLVLFRTPRRHTGDVSVPAERSTEPTTNKFSEVEREQETSDRTRREQRTSLGLRENWKHASGAIARRVAQVARGEDGRVKGDI